MTHIFNEEMKIAHTEEQEGPVLVSLPGTDGMDEKSLLSEILLELKKITLHLSLMTDERITEEDI